MRLIFLGAPGAGKGTQAEIASEKYKIPTISTGSIIRQAIIGETSLGLTAKPYVQSGKLAPDDVVIELVEERLKKDDCADGFILDGFPRTVPQAQWLDRGGVNIDKVIDIEVDDEVILDRITGRRMCGRCGANYHIRHKMPEIDGACDRCAGILVIRVDDQPDIVRARLKVYHRDTEPLKEYYRKSGKLAIVECASDLKETTERTIAAIEAELP
jgi:adenylate kinase